MSLLLSSLKSPVPAIVHGLAAAPGEPLSMIDAPLSSQTTPSPVLVLY
jgi:hypothetical protein